MQVTGYMNSTGLEKNRNHIYLKVRQALLEKHPTELKTLNGNLSAFLSFGPSIPDQGISIFGKLKNEAQLGLCLPLLGL